MISRIALREGRGLFLKKIVFFFNQFSFLLFEIFQIFSRQCNFGGLLVALPDTQRLIQILSSNG
ncbi:MAG: hypothetical protein CMI00_13065 [Oceanospirillaceae bacterium]|nr:hypothetical protein [Oceanospirillaceae bacterium]